VQAFSVLFFQGCISTSTAGENMSTIAERVGIEARAADEPNATAKQCGLLHHLGVKSYDELSKLGKDQASRLIDLLKYHEEERKKKTDRVVGGSVIVVAGIAFVLVWPVWGIITLLIGAAVIWYGIFSGNALRQHLDVLND
jgi:hypothetical protein